MKLKDQGQNGYYLLGDRPSTAEQKTFGFTGGEFNIWSAHINPFRAGHRGLVAVSTGEIRSPKKDEWYLSGAVVMAYRAPNDLCSGLFHIAKLVAVETELQTTASKMEEIKEFE